MAQPIQIWKIGRLPTLLESIALPGVPKTLDDANRRLPEGGYTTFRTFYRFSILRLEDHFHRLEETAALAGQPVTLDQEQVCAALHEALARYPAENMRVRLTLDLRDVPGTVYILIEELRVPSPEAYQRGVRVVTRSLHRDNPKAKLTGFITQAADVRQGLPRGVNEAVMVGEDGLALEGLSSNFFAVKDGLVWTAEKGVLAGITRAMALEVIRERQIPLRLEGISAEALPCLDEAFLTSASRAVLPVVSIDGAAVGGGQPGRLTREIMQGYQALIDRELVRV